MKTATAILCAAFAFLAWLWLTGCTADGRVDFQAISQVAGAATGAYDRYQQRERTHYPDLVAEDGELIEGPPR